MGVCYIVGAGECKKLDFKKKNGDLLIAADGGCLHLEKAGINSDIVIGDFDSLNTPPECGEIIKLNPIKDITDMDAAVKIGIDRGFGEFHLYGACGGRIDHTLANIQLIASLSQKNIKAFIHDDKTIITAVTDGSLKFDKSFKGYVSVFAHSDKCGGVYIKGLKYPLENVELKNNFPLGVSNEFIGVESEIIIKSGTVIVTYQL